MTQHTGGVLVVDDDEGMRETLVDILAATGIAAEGVGSAAAARRSVQERVPSVALVDQRLPDANGIELGSMLKQQDADLTVLLVTGYASLENAIAAVGHVDGFLTKPVPPAELLRVVRAGMDSARLRRENRALLDELQRANLLLETSVDERTRELSGLLDMAEAVAVSIELDDVVGACLSCARDVTEARYAGLYLCGDEPDGELELRATTGVASLPDRLELPPPEGSGLGDVVALTAGGRRVGALVLGAATRRQPMFLATLAGSAAIAIQNAQRFGREREAVERLSELSRMKSTFLATVSHELRSPLTSVIGFAEMLGMSFETASRERQLEMIDHIGEQGRRLAVLIDDLLDATRVEFGGLRVRLGTVDVATVVSRVEVAFRGAGSPVSARLAPELPAAMADETRLEQVLTNLVANAVKHSPPDATVELRVDAEGGEVRLAVIDRGPGMPAELIDQVFEPFTQGSVEAGGRKDGLGLGLYISRGLAEAMGGTIEAHSRPGQGSTLLVRLKQAAREVVA